MAPVAVAPVGAEVSAYVQWHITTPDGAETAQTQQVFEGGLILLITNNLQWDGEYGVGLNSETPDYFVDGVLEVRLAGGEREVESATATAAVDGILDGLAGGVVVVAEGFALAGGRGAAVATFEDVGAEGADVFDDFDGLVHGYPLPRVLF